MKSVFANTEKSLDFIGQFLHDTRSQTAGNYFTEIEKELDTKGLYEFQSPEWVSEFIYGMTAEDLAKLSEERLTIYQTMKEILSRPSKAGPVE
ncbi:MAG: hypothetical protein IMZ53_00160 [Thermoplasmata archaeon]|nr:hypothetical protein [Thermoplasmata archaeon]